ncbi:MBL fold metallo-hydrolase [Candidatus Nitrosocosmicus agrestis]|jgi:glyoxylase-like metal-dependent hydrolase (beta-lactamase superfamily II)/rhodanese-related sulfurtransferase|uniref:MBL fold metallo-hydrolase n=1 Tax=Candidatus Nitrosocosmicus agrestis TaxID=2563600 RepID=UPI00122E03B8|nr:rhodanese-like domain-containing protein [Candidatus Nitrosocosmicus sp. SS]KAA2281426.1 MBL fold metallo-hydrolase [Candidatus Nitrosocosmicus sp. SS]KAF0867778.1 MBL fold metallo-hydrolase [Candidatus Nitrosocosmicus sp. SS]MDR4490567.1 MBL fold metallo-hydrolase [Candidatus Nitrosocosmicus sp.]
MISNFGPSSGSHKNNLVIKPFELKKKIDEGDDFFILDVRTKQEHDMWSISYDKYKDSTLIPIDTIMQNESLKKLPKDKEIIVFCAHGQRSSMAAMALSSLGYNVKTVEGGMDGWSNLYDVANLEIDNSLPLRIWQIRRISKGCMSYLITSTVDKKATIIDPTCNIDGIVDDLIAQYGLTIERVIDTHLHADHLSGSSKIARKYNCDLILSSYENYNLTELSGFDVQRVKLVKGGENFKLGDELEIKAIHTPGHTQGSISYLLNSNKQGNNSFSIDEPDKINHTNALYLFAGDTIFVNGVGRPDLHNKAQEYTAMLYQTYKDYILELPTNVTLLPSHYSESFNHGKVISNTIDAVRNKLTGISNSSDDFAAYVNSNIPTQPMNYEKIVKLNKNLVSCDQVYYRDLEAGPNSCGIKA